MTEAKQGVGEEAPGTSAPITSAPITSAPVNGDNRLSESFWATGDREFDDFAGQDQRLGGEVDPGLVSLTQIQAAIRRKFRMWFSLALVGFIAGVGLYVERPAGSSATTSLLLSPPPNAAQGWIADDQALAQSNTVAGMALRILGLGRESAAVFAKAYTVVPLTDRVLQITLKGAPSAAAAVRDANAIDAAFLNFQARLLTDQQKLLDAAFEQQVSAAGQKLAQLDTQIAGLAPSSPARKTLEAQRAREAASLISLKQTVTTDEAAIAAATTTAIKDSGVLDPAAVVLVHSKRRLAEYVGGGLIAGLVLGLGTVVVAAIVSNRLRRRDEVARALGAPVRLSIGKVRPEGRALLRRGLAAARDANLSRVIAHLGGAVTPSPGGFATLAVVPVDDAPPGSSEVAAVCLASLAALSAQQGMAVVLADLYRGAPAARILGVSDPGVAEVTVDGSRLVVIVPEVEDAMPTGPLRRPAYGSAAEQAKAACASANLVLTLAGLDPGFGGDYLAGWTTSVVALFSAGRSSAERVQAVGEMVRLAGITQLSAVLVGADKTDESIGLTVAPVVGSARPAAARLTTAEADLGHHRDLAGERSSSAPFSYE